VLHHGSLHQADRQNKEILLTEDEQIMLLKAKIKEVTDLLNKALEKLNE